MTKDVNVREIAIEALQEILEKGGMSHQVLAAALEKYQYLKKQERAFFSRTVEGSLEHLLQLDYILNQFSKTPVRKMKPFIRNLLRMSVYHLFYMDSIPDRAVVSEAVKLAERRGFFGLKGFVNGLLRTIVRKREEIAWPKERQAALSIQYSIPEWLIKEWLAMLPEKTVGAMLKGLSKERPLTVRCNQNKCSTQELIRRLELEGLQAEIHPYLPYALEISGYDYLKKLTSFREGCFQVQDISSMLTAELGARFHPRLVLDVCAAPGGKAIAMAELAGEKTRVEARDKSARKVALIEENKKKSGITNVKCRVWDALKPDEEMKEKADLVLADLPCSGLGVLGKKRDICYKTTEKDIGNLAKLQRAMLSVVWQYVKPGGILIYSTCTITREENLGNLNWLLKACPFEAVDLSPYFPEALQEASMKKGYLQLLPGIHRSDGFFISALKRISK